MFSLCGVSIVHRVGLNREEAEETLCLSGETHGVFS